MDFENLDGTSCSIEQNCVTDYGEIMQWIVKDRFFCILSWKILIIILLFYLYHGFNRCTCNNFSILSSYHQQNELRFYKHCD